jgi:hypothetical protein
MGRSWPSFVHEDCSGALLQRYENGTIIDIQLPPELEGDSQFLINSTGLDEEYVKAFLRHRKYRVETCWKCTTCDFVLEAEQPDGNVTQFHFLQYSGTRQLAEDSKWRRLSHSKSKLSPVAYDADTLPMNNITQSYP